MIITEPGIYDMPADIYHADPVPGGSLSHTGARMLLPPNCPAKFKHWRDHSEQPSGTFDIGHAAHDIILEGTDRIAQVNADDWRANVAKEARAAAYEAGRIPLLAKDADTVLDMHAVITEHPQARELLWHEGKPEQSLFWHDPTTSVMLRARVDWLRPGLIVDYKTCKSAHPDAIAKAMWDYRYCQQADWYTGGADILWHYAYHPRFVFIFQEKTAPYLVTVVEPDVDMLNWGHQLNRDAIDLYHQCTVFDHWPGYGAGTLTVSLPIWARKQLESWYPA